MVTFFGWESEYVNLYIPTQTPVAICILQSPGWPATLHVYFAYVWSFDLQT